MKMRIVTLMVAAMGLLIGVSRMGTVARAGDDDDENNIALLDNCDPRDSAWNALGGCFARPKNGHVTVAEFNAFLFTPLSPPGVLIGHPSWRIQPSFLFTDDHSIRVRNGGGRAHTFTQVINYGGGFVPQINGNLSPAQECLASPAVLAPGQSSKLNLNKGVHKFQCCIHPWMRAAIRIE
jgi:hypothetical protein